MRLVSKYLKDNAGAAEMLWGDEREGMRVLSRSSFVPDKICALCGRKLKGKTHTDHDHATGLIRGELHATCNVHLGHFEKSGRWMFNRKSGVTEQKIMGYLMQAEMQGERYAYESRLSILKRCWKLVIESSDKDECKQRAVDAGLPWLWCWMLALQQQVKWECKSNIVPELELLQMT